MSNNDTPADFEEVTIQLSLNSQSLHKALDSISRGLNISDEEREEIALLVRGDRFFVKREEQQDAESAAVKALMKLLGRDLRKALVNVSQGGSITAYERDKLKEWLYSAGRARRRDERWKYVSLILFTLGVLTISLAIVQYIFPQTVPNRIVLPPLIVSIAILAGAVIKDAFIDKNIEAALDDVKSISEKTRQDVVGILDTNLRPRIISLDSREEVMRAANEILLEAFQESRERRFVYFMGAASLSTQEDSIATEEARLSLVDQYNNRLRTLEGAKVPIKRFISLIKPEEIRREGTLREYVRWLNNQIQLLKGNPRYEIVDCPRAQPWGGSRSSIVTFRAFLDIVGEGSSGFIIKDEEVARTLKESSEKLFASAKQVSYGGDEGARNLEALKGKMRVKP